MIPICQWCNKPLEKGYSKTILDTKGEPYYFHIQCYEAYGKWFNERFTPFGGL